VPATNRKLSSTQLVNLVVDLDERFADDAAARERLTRAGFVVETRAGASDPALAWIDDVFGGAWSSEVAVGQCAIAMRDGKPAGFAAFDSKGLRYAWLRGIAREPDVGVFGPFGVAPEYRGIGSALLEIALCGLRSRGYRRALIAATSERLVPYYARHANARVVERYDPLQFTPTPVRTVVLASGSGTNFQAVIDRVATGLPLELTALVSNKGDAFAIERARRAGIPALVLPWLRSEQSRDRYDASVRDAVAQFDPELVLLLGWMHLLDPAFVAAFPQLLNVHPAFLSLDPARDTVGMPDGTTIPAFRGPRAVRDALAAASPWIGASVHEVTMDIDRGRVLARKPLQVLLGEDEDAALTRLHPIEHQLVATAIKRWLYERE
jgi:folate-dependent phosphoribosylglycinamide formyltransferase PurN